MLNDNELWLDFFKVIVTANKISSLAQNAKNADMMLQEYKNRFGTNPAKPVGPANEIINTWGQRKQTNQSLTLNEIKLCSDTLST